jgi:hypothetical protein
MHVLRKTRVKSFRLDCGLIEALGKAARRANMTENAFLSRVLEGRLAIDPLFPAFDGLSLSSSILRSILGAANVDALETAASDAGHKDFPLIRELFAASDRPITLRMFVIDILGKCGRWFHVEGDASRTHRWTTLRHGCGLKWSKYIRAYILGAHGTISRDRLEIGVTDQVVRIEFPPE